MSHCLHAAAMQCSDNNVRTAPANICNPVLQSYSFFCRATTELDFESCVHCRPLAMQPCAASQTPCLHKSKDKVCPSQVQTLGAEVEVSKQRQHRAEQEHQFALAALQAQLKHAAGEMEVLRAGAGHTKDQALSALKVCPLCLEGRPSLPWRLALSALKAGPVCLEGRSSLP